MATRTRIPDEVYNRHFPAAAGLIMDALSVTSTGNELIVETIRRLADWPREDHYLFVEERVGQLVGAADGRSCA